MKPRILVRVTMKREDDGGRHAAFTEGYCPHLVAEGTETWLGVRASACPGPVAPGDTAEVGFELMYYPGLDYSALVPGTKFFVMEGARAVGEGIVLGPLEA